MRRTEESDEALMKSYAGGEAQAFEELYRRHELRVWRYLERGVRNRAAADELMQEIWFTVAREAARYRPTARFTTWLFAIAHNRMIDWIRTTRPQVSLETDDDVDSFAPQWVADPNCEPLAETMTRDQARALNQAVGELPEEQRETFLLHVEGDLNIDDIASITRVSFETAKSRLRYARIKLRERLAEYA
jgi:RNA polymerase sigma-70 factor (ECF subfamily)